MFFLGFLLLLGAVQTYKLNDKKSLAREIYESVFKLGGYNANIRPVTDDRKAIDVVVYLELLAIHFLDEKSETFRVTVYMNLKWEDEFLKWNETILNVTSLTYSQSDIWTPQLVLTNSFDKFKSLGDENLKLMVQPDGTVTWETIELLTLTCQLDTTFFPFDIQTCNMNFVVWNYFREHVRLIPFHNKQETGLKEIESNPAWEIQILKSSIGKLRKSSIGFSVTLKRKANYYIQNFILPTILLTMLNLMTFILPHDSGERATYSITVFLSMVVMLTILNSVLPESSNTTCIFALYLVIETGLSTLMTIINIVLIRMANFNNDTHVPMCLKAFVVCCCRKTTVTPDEDEKDLESIMSEKEEPHVDWVDAVRALDKLCFVIFLATSCLVSFIMLYVCAARTHDISQP